LNPEGTATDRNVMYDGNMPSNKTTLKMNLKKIRQIFEKILGETCIHTPHCEDKAGHGTCGSTYS
jgi:hypothetical protein